MSAFLSIRNRQRTRRVNTPLLKSITRQVIAELQVSSYELGIHLVNAPEMAQVNQQFLNHEGSTDVITFDYGAGDGGPKSARDPMEFLSGEIFVCIDDAVKQAREFKMTWQSELARYVIHGLLHLRGYDDLQPALRRVMKREENRLVRHVEAMFSLRSLDAQDS